MVNHDDLKAIGYLFVMVWNALREHGLKDLIKDLFDYGVILIGSLLGIDVEAITRGDTSGFPIQAGAEISKRMHEHPEEFL